MIKIPTSTIQMTGAGIFFLLTWAWSGPLHIPDTTSLIDEHSYEIKQRNEGFPFKLTKEFQGKNLLLELIWDDHKMIGLRYSMKGNLPPEVFQDLVSLHGAGGSWHEHLAPVEPKLKTEIPGLEQQWFLKGYGEEVSWLGSGLNNNQFFLLFLSDPPFGTKTNSQPLKIDKDFYTSLSHSTQWLRRNCPEKSENKFCYSHSSQPRWTLSVNDVSPVSLKLQMKEGQPFPELAQALRTVPGREQNSYAKDLANILHGEAQTALHKMIQEIPFVFNLSSLEFQGLKGSKIPHEAFLKYLETGAETPSVLPAYHYHNNNVDLKVDFHLDGAFEIIVNEKTE